MISLINIGLNFALMALLSMYAIKFNRYLKETSHNKEDY